MTLSDKFVSFKWENNRGDLATKIFFPANIGKTSRKTVGFTSMMFTVYMIRIISKQIVFGNG